MASKSSSRRSRSRMPIGWRIALELLVVVVLFALAVWIGLYLRTDQQVAGQSELRRYWLGLLAVLFYLTVRLAFLTYSMRPGAIEPIPDLDTALDIGLEAIDRAGISIQDTPIHLVVGTLPDEEAALSTSPRIERTIQVAEANLPIHFYGGSNGIWITLPGVSAISKEAQVTAGILRAIRWPGRRRLAADAATQWPDQPQPAASVQSNQADSATLGIGNIDMPLISESMSMSPEEKLHYRQRMEYVMQALKRIRHPLCPLNSVVLAFQWDWLSIPNLAHILDAISIDMTAMQGTLGIRCLCTVLFLGIEKSPDFIEYVRCLESSELESRLGCGLPSLCSMKSLDMDAMHDWLIRFFEIQTLERLRRDIRRHKTNRKLYRLLDTLRHSRQSFGLLMTNAAGTDAEEPFHLGGVYFASAQRIDQLDRPLFDAVIDRINRDHDEAIGWSTQALEHDQRLHGWSLVLMSLATVLTVVGAITFLANLMRW